MSLYSDAVNLVAEISKNRQHELDMAAIAARNSNFKAQRKAILAVPDNFRWKPVLELLANTFVIGRDDGYPEISIPTDTANVLRAAYCAGMTCHLRFCGSFDSFAVKPDEAAWCEDYNAWRSAKEYRETQKVRGL